METHTMKVFERYVLLASVLFLPVGCSGEEGAAGDGGADGGEVREVSGDDGMDAGSDALEEEDTGPTDCGLLGQPCPTGFECTPIAFQLLNNGIEEYCYSEDEDAVFVPADEFWMGCERTGDFDCRIWSRPKHAVSTPPYVMLQTPVTFRQYQRCLDDADGGCTPPDIKSESKAEAIPEQPEYPDLMMNWVSWDDANAYCGWLAEETGKPWRLCSESEWAKAARGGCETLGEQMAEGQSCDEATRLYPWGNAAPTCDLAWWTMMCDMPDWQTHQSPPPVRARPESASAYGMLGAWGTVRQWVADCYHSPMTDHPTDGSAWTDDCERYDDGEIKWVNRGVFWRCGESTHPKSPIYRCPLHDRWYGRHDSKSGGIRCCRDFEP